MQEPTPAFIIPSVGMFLWNIYFRISESVNRISDSGGVYRLIPPTEYRAWFDLTDTLVYPHEYDMLVAMDKAYCDEANKELEDIRSKRQEEQQRQVEQERNSRRRSR